MTELMLHEDEGPNIGMQALWILIHTLVAFGSWVAMMAFITLFNPSSVPAAITWAISLAFPALVGYLFTMAKQNEMAPHVWLIGFIWFLIICLWVLDMPTGPNQCYHCDATQKILLTFFSTTEDSGLIDGQGRLVGTWPATAIMGYSFAAGFALKPKSNPKR
jgi:hypothetical protein